MPFKDTNVVFGLAADDDVQIGRSNQDPAPIIEAGAFLPTVSDAAATYMYFECAIGTILDSGIVVHHRLPQVNRGTDSLSYSYIDDPQLDTIKPTDNYGVNIKCKDQYNDIIQRMGHARYWFRLWGQAIRFKYQIPIPGLKTVGGVPAIPYDKNPQWAFNRIAPGANYSGIIMWHAEWSLWYTTAVPPKSNVIPATDLAGHISNLVAGTVDAMQAPYSGPDDDATNLNLDTIITER